MKESINPYQAWLALPSNIDAPSYYQLLELDDSQQDAAVIAAAADRAIARVRSCRPGAHITAWTQLLDQLAEAKACLTNAERKRAYDERLRSGSMSDAARVPTAGVASPPDEPGVQPAGATTPNVRPASRRAERAAGERAQSRRAPLLWALTCLGLAAVAVVLVRRGELFGRGEVAQARRDTQQSPGETQQTPRPGQRPRPSPREQAAEIRSEPDVREPLEQPNTGEEPTVPGEVRPTTVTEAGEPVPAVESPPDAGPEYRQQLSQLLMEARSAIAVRDFQAAKERLAEASRLARPEHAERVRRLEQLANAVRQFWNGIDQTLRNVPGLAEFPFRNGVAVVREKPAEFFKFRFAGRNQEVPVAELPPELARAVAAAWFDSRDATNLLLRGAFEASQQPLTDELRDQARSLWQQARASGADVDDLLKILEEEEDITDESAGGP